MQSARSSPRSSDRRAVVLGAPRRWSRRPQARRRPHRHPLQREGMDSASEAGEVTRLYAATGDAIARLAAGGDEWTVELSLRGSGAQCLAVDPRDPETVYAGLREGGVRRTTDGGRTWADCGLPEPGVFSLAVSAADGAVYAGTEPSRLYRSDDGGRTW